MAYKVHIRKTDTGEVRICDFPDLEWFKGIDEYGDERTDDWWWTQGNYGCDCNRELEWRRAGGEEPDLDEVKCGHTLYAVDLVELPDGTTFEIDDRTR